MATVQLKAEYTDGTETVGEAEIPQPGKEISRVSLVPSEVKAVPEAVQAILDADLIVLGPGSLYTSVIPNLLVDPIVEALEQAEAIKVYVCNVMTQPGETTGFSASDHVYALLKHADFRPIIDYVLVNDTPISSWQAEKYAEQGAYPVQLDRNRLENMGLEVVTGSLIDHADLVRHNSARLAEHCCGFGRNIGNLVWFISSLCGIYLWGRGYCAALVSCGGPVFGTQHGCSLDTTFAAPPLLRSKARCYS